MILEGYKVAATNFRHPTITSGQHTNGPQSLWVLIGDEWVRTRARSLHKLHRELLNHGTERIQNGTWDGVSE